MGFKFSFLVELLEDLESNRFRKLLTASKSVNPDCAIILSWFNRHDAKIQRSPDQGVAFLSSLFPERRPDRCYHMQETRLASVFGRVYQLGTGRLKELRAWKERTPADFANCLASVLAQTELPPPRPGDEVTLEEIDDVLNAIAANVKSSAPALRLKSTPFDVVDLLTPVLCRLQSVEVKWFVRMLLKSYHPIQIPETFTMKQFHFMLPRLLTIQNDFSAAMETLKHAELVQLPYRVSDADAMKLKVRLASHLVPRIGVMIKRQAYYKARSIKHCCQMADHKVMSVEKKYDGEYCQIHIDMSKDPSERILIFSKSGRDSTEDRIRLHHAIEIGLNMISRSQQCKIKERCILEGELVIWGRRLEAIQPFHKIRKHVQHGGRYLSHEADSPVALDEQVMIVYYDILLLDNIMYLEKPQEERRRCLERVISPTKGLVQIGERVVLDFESSKTLDYLRALFASCIGQRSEGLVLKSCADPYFSYTTEVHGMKLKKDYMTQLGDLADVAIIGARLDSKVQRKLRHDELKWNTFYMACLENKSEVVRFQRKPIVRVLGEVSFINKHDMEYLNTRGRVVAVDFASSMEFMEITKDQKQTNLPEVVFKTPFVVEVLGSGYERAPNATYWTLRHPRIHKIHGDRSIAETVSFDDFQDMAKTAQTAPSSKILQEDCDWIRRLEDANPKSHYVVDTSQSTATTPEKSQGYAFSEIPKLLSSASKSPLFDIWTDLGRPSEVANEVISEKSSPLARSVTCSALKRRCGEDAEVLQSKKRRKIAPENSPYTFPGSEIDSSSLMRETRSRRIVSASELKRTLVKKSPPWCRQGRGDSNTDLSPFIPPAVFDPSPVGSSSQPTECVVAIRASKHARAPLAEVLNLFGQRSILPSVQRTSFSSGDLQPKSIKLFESSIMASSSENEVLSQTQPHTLPTPPSSATEPKQKRSSTHGPPAQASKSAASPASEKLQRLPQLERTMTAAVEQPPTLTPPPFLLTSCLRQLSQASSKILSHLLRHTESSFTHSHSHFLAHVALNPVVMVLVCCDAHPHVLADIIRRLMADMNEMEPKQKRSGKVLFLDWRFLGLLELGRALTDVLMCSREFAAGCLIWSCDAVDDRDTKLEIRVRTCFEWDEALKS